MAGWHPLNRRLYPFSVLFGQRQKCSVKYYKAAEPVARKLKALPLYFKKR
jgi:hypothetical protein